MNKNEVLNQLRRDFHYEADGRLDNWRLHIAAGRVVGDCEDFALALAWRLAGESWVRFVLHLFFKVSVIWHVTAPNGEGHAVLWHHRQGWACNIYPRWLASTPNRRRFPRPFISVVISLLVGPVLRWISRTFKRAKRKG